MCFIYFIKYPSKMLKDKLSKELEENLYTDLSKSMIRLRIYFQSMTTEVTTEAVSISAIQLVGYFGGILGFSLGCSMISYFEIFETVILLIHHNFIKKELNKKIKPKQID